LNFPDFGPFTIQERDALKSYGYRMLRQYLSTPDSDPMHRRRERNLLGEVYENAMYEKLLCWANQEEGAADFVLKGPHVEPSPPGDNGFTYDPNRQIYYYSDGETIAEFDAMFRVRQFQVFVEIADTNSESNIDQMKYEIQRKMNLLRLLFSNQIVCWIVTTYEKEIGLEELPGVHVLKTPKYTFDLDLKTLPRPNKIMTAASPDSSKFVTISSLSHEPFSYFQVLANAQREFGGATPDHIRRRLPEFISPYLGLVERVFLGKMSFADFETLMTARVGDGTEISQSYLALKVKSLGPWQLTAYLVDKTGTLYEIDWDTMEAKPIEARKRSTRDVRYLDSRLNWLDVTLAREYMSCFPWYKPMGKL
jgi:hypothetical protein